MVIKKFLKIKVQPFLVMETQVVRIDYIMKNLIISIAQFIKKLL